MNSRLVWKACIVLFVVIWAAFELYPPQGRPLLAEFERRAVAPDESFEKIMVRARELQAEHPERAYGNLWDAVGTNQLTRYFPDVPTKGDLNPNRAILNRLQRDAAGKIKLGLDLQGGSSFLVGMDTNQMATVQDKERSLAQAVEVLRKRVDRFGVAEPVIQPAGEDRILIQLPGLSEADRLSAKTQIERAAFLEFRLVHPESQQLLNEGMIVPGYEVLQQVTQRRDRAPVVTSYLVQKKPVRGLTGKYVKSAGVSRDPVSNRPNIHVAFDTEGARLFGEITRENVNRQLAIVLDGELYSAPNITEPIPGGNCQISGDFDLREAYELANVLENPLEAPVKILEERSVEPSLGSDSIQSGLRATLIGLAAVLAFMLGYYLFAGLLANAALLLNLVILLGVMCSINATLTLPGIAGILLTIGMAVDANVLIYERVREELLAGKSLRGAIAGGYGKAFSTIFDANLTTLIASIILIVFGTGPVKGFGTTLTIGIAASMFTALVFTRLVFDWLLAKGWLKSLPMFQLIRKPEFDFLRWSKIAAAISIVLVLIGLGNGLSRGKDVLGHEFAGGDALTLEFKQKAEVDEIRAAIQKLNLGQPQIGYEKSMGDASETLRILTAFDTGTQIEEAIKGEFPEAGFHVLSMEKVGPSVGREIQKAALIAALLALFSILVYVAFRYELSFAIAAIIAIAHDVLITVGLFFLAGGQLSATMVAAVLTIIGFSINATIVVFDRVREDLKLGYRGSFKEIINMALNQTLSRTLITSGTTLISALALYLFGGAVIHDFAFTFMVGVISGTYSSIFIAGALVLWWHKGERPRASATVALDSASPAQS